jgi:hypothetical protein
MALQSSNGGEYVLSISFIDVPSSRSSQINAQRFPVWSSLARDYLSIMASSVSSERAFSSAGITISKRRNRLKHDVVEALQFLKCALRRDLIFREPEPSSVVEDVDDDDPGSEQETAELAAWDSFVLDEDCPPDDEGDSSDVSMDLFDM